MIKTIEDIQKLVLDDFSDWQSLGHVTVRDFDGLLVFNYNAMAQYAGDWNDFEILSRGLIIDAQTGEIVARAFDKFFNWNEGERYTTAKLVHIEEKMDGSLGILYRKNENYHISTRGSLESEQALWATGYLNQHHNLTDLPTEYTLLFEIIYPDNRIVVDYGNRQDLVLLAVRNRFTGEYLSSDETFKLSIQYGFSTPASFQFKSVDSLIHSLESLNSNEEGFIALFADGSRFKFKGLAYLRLHKLLSTLSFKNILIAHESGGLTTFLEQIPDEFLLQVKQWIAEIDTVLASETARLNNLFSLAPKQDRKTFALWVMGEHKSDSRYLFAMYDTKDILPILYKTYDWQSLNERTMKDTEA